MCQHGRVLRLGLIADDLTGACDAGVQFAQRGFLSVVQLGSMPLPLDLADLKILNTNSRNDPPELARFKVSEALRSLKEEGRELTYKKIDSTLRGNLGAEIEAAMGERRLAVVAPAFPAMGRLILDGTLRVAGAVPPRVSHLPTLLRRQTRRKVIHFSGRFVSEGGEALRRRLEEVSKQARSIVVMDTRTEADLAVIARAAWRLQEPPLMVGSAGLAAEIAELLRARHRRRHGPASQGPRSDRSRRPVVLIIGSTHRISALQSDYLLAHRPAIPLALDGKCLRKFRRAIREKRHILIKLSLADYDSGRLAPLTEMVTSNGVGGIVLTGGDTADLVVRALDARGIILAREILPGIPWGRLMGGLADGKPIATKAGPFGRPDALAVTGDYLARLRSD